MKSDEPVLVRSSDFVLMVSVVVVLMVQAAICLVGYMITFFFPWHVPIEDIALACSVASLIFVNVTFVYHFLLWVKECYDVETGKIVIGQVIT